MKRIRTWVALAMAVSVLLVSSVAFAAGNTSNMASFFGMTDEELQTALDGGYSVGDLATERGMVPQVKQALINQEQAYLHNCVLAGQMTQLDASLALENYSAALSAWDGTGNPLLPDSSRGVGSMYNAQDPYYGSIVLP